MRVWTVQPEVVRTTLESEGSIRPDPRCMYDAETGWIPESYSWLIAQTRERLDESSGGPLWWAYCRKPDLRLHRHGWPRGSRHVRLELEVPEGSIVAFPCWAWNRVFGGRYLGLDGREDRAWRGRVRRAIGRGYQDACGPLPEPFQGELEASWRRIFSPDLPERSWSREDFRSADREAVLPILRREWVTDVTPFEGARAPWDGGHGDASVSEEAAAVA